MDWERLLEICEFAEHEKDCEGVEGESMNRGCGDWVRFSVSLKDGGIEACFHHRGCMVSKAAAETIAEMVEGKSIEEARKIGLEDVVERLGIVKTRVRCVETAFKAFRNALECLDQ